jgi:hypothetical protein
MTTSIEATPITEAERQRRAEFVKGMRAYADALEANPETLPLPYQGTDTEIATYHFLYADDPRTELAAAVRALRGVKWDKDTRDDGYFDLIGRLHGLRIRLSAYRKDVCERVVTGTSEVTKKVKDPEALAAVPEIEVTETVEEVRWECRSILAPATSEAKGAAA